MLSAFRAAVLAAATTVLSVGSAVGQSLDLGSNSASLRFGLLSGDESLATLDGAVDFSITRYHGLQIDLGAANYEHFWKGNVTAHLYMQPQERAKYGVFFSYADANNEEASTMDFGFEGLWTIGGSIAAEGRLGMGRAGGESEVDYIFGSARGYFDLSDQFALTAGILLLDVDEKAGQYRNVRLETGLSYSMPNLPISLDFGVDHSRISGSLVRSETRLALGGTIQLGAPKAGSKTSRHFSPVRPLRDLVAADVVWPNITARELRRQGR